MKILIPAQLFLRVKEKNYAHFAHKDMALDRDALAVYLRLFSLAIDSGSVRLPQSELAADCRICVRALQNALRRLGEIAYIAVECAPGHCCSYYLLLSPRVLAQIRKYDLIDNPAWYARRSSGRASGVPVAHPPHGLRGGYAPHAYPSYKEDKKLQENTLQPSLPENSNVAPPDAPGRGAFSPAAKAEPAAARPARPAPMATADAPAAAFERLWAVWPVKQSKAQALRIFLSLWRQKALPAPTQLLDAVARFKTTDRRWLRGYAPNLDNWLRGRRWEDEILPLPAADGAAVAPSADQERDARKSREKLERAARQILAATPPLPDLPAALSDAAEKLCRIWPGQSTRTPVKAFFRSRLAAGGLPDPDALLQAAGAYLADAVRPCGLLGWLMMLTQQQEQRGCAA